MQLLDSGDRRLGVFLMISVLIHGVLVFAFPQLRSLGIIGSPDGRMDGVIQVIRVESADSARSQSAKVVAKNPQPAAKPKEEPKPKAEPPKKETVQSKPAVKNEPAKQVVDKPKTTPAAKPPENAKPTVKETKPSTNKPTATPVEQKTDKSAGVTDAGLLTSEKGQEVIVSEERSKSTESAEAGKAAENKQTETKVEPEAESSSQENVATESSPSANESKTSSDSASDMGAEGTEESASPPLPPLPGANSIFPRTRVAYPKGAQNEDAGGTWVGNVLFPTGKKSPVVLSVTQATGNRSLDSFAKGLIERGIQFPDSGVDYVAVVEIVFTGSPNYDVKVNVKRIDYAQSQ